ncbi:hypothetical protein At1D1460_43650 [Agrobacterium tumefaciens]|nr:hypothetical protein At1D1460_43650 [Agrobacterium tumefaciens]
MVFQPKTDLCGSLQLPNLRSHVVPEGPDRVVQVLEHVPASVKIVRHVEKRMICKECDTTVAGEMPTLPIERGKPGPELLADVAHGVKL